MKTYEDTTGKVFKTQQEAAASNTALGTNPKTKSVAPVTPTPTAPAPSEPTSASVIGTKPVSIRPTTPSTTAMGLEETIASNNEAIKKQNELDNKAMQDQVDSGKKDITSTFNELAGLGAQKEQILKNEGADVAKKAADEYTSQIEAEQLTTRRRIESLQKNNPQGLFGGGLEQEVNRIQNESTMKQADLAILQNAALRKYDTATAIADRKIALQTEALKTRLEGLKFFYEDNKAELTKAQDRQYQEAIKKEERAYDKAEKEATTVTNLGLQVATNQAPAAIASKALAAKTVAELMAIPGVGKYMQSPLERLQVQKASLDVKKATQELKDVMETSAGDGITTEQRDAIVKNPTAIKAASRLGVISAVKQYKDLVSQYYGTGTVGLISPAKRAKLDAMLNTTVGSAINVAQGQGAMGDEEAKRILGGLKVTNWNSPRKIQSAADGVITAQDSLYENDINFLESGIPGARAGYQLFADYDRAKTDPLLLIGSSQILNPLNLNL